MNASEREAGLWQLFIVFARVSVTTIGGGYVMLPVMEREVVDRNGWLSHDELVDYFALAQSVPGVIAMNCSTLIGFKKRGVAGAVAAGLGMSLPSVVVIMLVAAFFVPYLELAWVQKAFAGIRAAVLAMVLVALWRFGRQALRGVVTTVIMVLVVMGVLLFEVSPVWGIVGGGLAGGLFLGRRSGGC
jgi:chromate transporter